MKTLHIIVANKIATYSNRSGEIVCGNSDYQIEFNFDAEWDAYETKTARFIWNGKYKDIVFTGTVCPVPIVANTNRLEVGVYAEELCTTTSAVINCLRSIRCNSDIKSEGAVVVPEGTPILGEATITENGEHYPEKGYDGFYKVTVKVPTEIPDGYIKPTGTKEITANDTYDVAEYASVKVNVPTGSGEDIPEISEPLTLMASKEGAEEGELVVAYNLSEKVALPTGTNKPLGFLKDDFFLPKHIEKGVTIFGVTGEYEGEGGGGDGEFTADKYFEGGYAEVNLPNATKIKQYSFYKDTIIETIKAPEATSIGDYAFNGCNALKSVLADKVTELGEYSFFGCSSLPSLNVPLVTQIKGSAFSGCSSLEEITAPLVKKIGSNAFLSCSNLKTVYFPDVTSIGSSAFTKCSFTEAIFPKCTDLGGGYTFQNNTALKKVVVKHASYLYYSTFQGCTSLEVFDCGNIRSVYSNAFKDCSSLKAFIIRNLSSVPSLNSINDFAGSGIANGSGYIYVPSAWVNNLASATNWSAFATQIRVLEDYTVDGTVNGELDNTKI